MNFSILSRFSRVARICFIILIFTSSILFAFDMTRGNYFYHDFWFTLFLTVFGFISGSYEIICLIRMKKT
jgi:hypothetical protein